MSCWGLNNFGQAGDAINAIVTVPYEVTLPATVVSIAVSGTATCAVLSTGDVWCWGDDSSGALGDGSTPTTGGVTPVAVEITAKDSFHSWMYCHTPTGKAYAVHHHSRA